MKRRTALITSAAGIAALLGLTQAYGAVERHGWSWRGQHGGFARLCGEGDAGHMDHAMAAARDALDIRADQEAAWAGFADSLRAATGRLAATCRGIEAAEPGTGAPDRLTQAEAMLAMGLAAVRDIRPSFDALYGVLDADQRRTLDAMLDHGNRA